MSSETSRWHVIYTMPRQEKQLINKLTEMKVKAFLPLIKTVNQWHDRKKIVDTPLFPSYIFVCVESKTDIYKVSALKGVVNFVKFGKEFATLTQSNIDNINLTITKSNHIEVTSAKFQPGERLLIKHGPLIGLECELISHKGKKKALVRMDMLNRNILINIELESIQEKNTL